MQTPTQFPKDFYWGAATASYQVEGGIENCDWAKAAREGRVPVAGKLADHYHLYKTDFAYARTLGHNAHRLSIEWARIEPEKGVFDYEEIAHYRAVLTELHKQGLEPFVTLWHFTLPQWFADSGSFERPDAAEIFSRYCNVVVDELSDLCSHFSTMNEENIMSNMGWLRGAWPPFKRFPLASVAYVATEHRETERDAYSTWKAPWLFFSVVKNLKAAHQLSYTTLKAKHPEINFSYVHQVHVFRANWNPINKLLAFAAHFILNGAFKSMYRYCDEIGLNYYHYKKFGDVTGYPKTDMGWEAHPDKIYDALLWVKQFNKPVIVTEAGLADAADTLRSDYIDQQVAGVWRAINAGVDVRGHFYWSLIDNYEWDLGVDKKFGLIAINYDTLERTVRPSAWHYKAIIEAAQAGTYSPPVPEDKRTTQ